MTDKDVKGRELEALAFGELQNGNAEYLVEYLRAGWPLEGRLAELLADILEGESGDWKTKIIARTKNRKTNKRISEVHSRNMEIGAIAHVRIEDCRHGEAKDIPRVIGKEVGVSAKVVRECLAYFRRQLAFARDPQATPHPLPIGDLTAQLVLINARAAEEVRKKSQNKN